jgi:hypothetical protein
MLPRSVADRKLHALVAGRNRVYGTSAFRETNSACDVSELVPSI